MKKESDTFGAAARATEATAALPAGWATVRRVRGPAEAIHAATGLRVVIGGCYTVAVEQAATMCAEGGEFEPASADDRERIDAARGNAA